MLIYMDINIKEVAINLKQRIDIAKQAFVSLPKFMIQQSHRKVQKEDHIQFVKYSYTYGFLLMFSFMSE